MSSSNPSQEAFEAAKRSFRDTLNDPALFKDILAASSVDHVWDMANKLQETQRPRSLRHMGKIMLFVERVNSYAGVIETFVQVQPDLLALIWGPIKLLILWSSQLAASLDALTKAMTNIGEALPHFAEVATIFGDKDVIKNLLALFYGDILHFYAVAMKFFKLTCMFCGLQE